MFLCVTCESRLRVSALSCLSVASWYAVVYSELRIYILIDDMYSCSYTTIFTNTFIGQSNVMLNFDYLTVRIQPLHLQVDELFLAKFLRFSQIINVESVVSSMGNTELSGEKAETVNSFTAAAAQKEKGSSSHVSVSNQSLPSSSSPSSSSSLVHRGGTSSPSSASTSTSPGGKVEIEPIPSSFSVAAPPLTSLPSSSCALSPSLSPSLSSISPPQPPPTTKTTTTTLLASSPAPSVKAVKRPFQNYFRDQLSYAKHDYTLTIRDPILAASHGDDGGFLSSIVKAEGPKKIYVSYLDIKHIQMRISMEVQFPDGMNMFAVVCVYLREQRVI